MLVLLIFFLTANAFAEKMCFCWGVDQTGGIETKTCGEKVPWAEDVYIQKNGSCFEVQQWCEWMENGKKDPSLDIEKYEKAYRDAEDVYQANSTLFNMIFHSSEVFGAASAYGRARLVYEKAVWILETEGRHECKFCAVKAIDCPLRPLLNGFAHADVEWLRVFYDKMFGYSKVPFDDLIAEKEKAVAQISEEFMGIERLEKLSDYEKDWSGKVFKNNVLFISQIFKEVQLLS